MTHLLIVCGIPGSGKSAFASYVHEHWSSINFESDVFLRELYGDTGGLAINNDFTKEAIERVYAAMSAAVSASFASEQKFVLAVGSFRSTEHRARFRAIAADSGVRSTTIRIDAPPGVASERVQSRIRGGGRGPTPQAIEMITTELGRADDIDMVLSNTGTLGRFQRRIDTVMESLDLVLRDGVHAPGPLVERFESHAATELALARELVDRERLRSWPLDRVAAVLRSSTPGGEFASITPTASQQCRIEAPAAHLDAVRRTLIEAGLRVDTVSNGLTVYLPALAPSARSEIVMTIEQELQRARDRIRDLRNCSLLGLSRPFDASWEAALQKAADKWVNAVDQLGNTALTELTADS